MREMTMDGKLPPYMAYPRFLLGMDLSETAKLVYVLLLDRARLSRRNGWVDERGRVFLYYPIVEIAEAIHASDMTVKRALAALTQHGLIRRVHLGGNLANRIYVRIPGQNKNDPPDGTKACRSGDQKCSANNNKSNNYQIRNYDCDEGESL